MLVAGVMSGSSLDGLDVVVVKFEDDKWTIIDAVNLDYNAEWENRLRDYHILSAREYIALKYQYSHYIGEMLSQYFRSRQIGVQYISFHGHTLVHSPSEGYTEQIGNGGIIAGLTGVSCITDFRNQDVALGGQGTPLAPFLDTEYLGSHDYYLNLGGIANITVANSVDTLAYDICPCNQVLNYYSLKKGKTYDKDGDIASQGRFDQDVAEYLSSFPYFSQLPPKSLDNNWIREVFIPGIPIGSPEDILHTYCVWMADRIAEQVRTEYHTTLYSTGGGTHNLFFADKLKSSLARNNCELIVPNKEMIDYKEAILMAALAKNYLDDKPNVMSTVTGARRDSIGGALYKV